MDDKFMETLRSFSVQDILEEQRPTTSHRNAGGGVGQSITRPPTGSITGRPPSSSVSRRDEGSEVTTLATYRPESAAFTFSFNRPRTGRMDAEKAARGPQPSASRSRQNNVSLRPPTSSRGRDETTEFIPDLDDVREEDLTMTVAAAPAYEIQKMTSLKELDAELLQSKAMSVVDGVNLSKLCAFLVPEKCLTELDESWTWDRLYTEIISTPNLSHLVRFQKKDAEMDLESFSSKA